MSNLKANRTQTKTVVQTDVNTYVSTSYNEANSNTLLALRRQPISASLPSVQLPFDPPRIFSGQQISHPMLCHARIPNSTAVLVPVWVSKRLLSKELVLSSLRLLSLNPRQWSTFTRRPS